VKGKAQFLCGGSIFTVDEKYEFQKRLGHGAYGVVASAIDKTTKGKVAIKKIAKAFSDLVDAKRVLREIKILKFFDHENIISLLDIEKPPAETGYEDVYIITELMEGDLHKLIYSKQKLTEQHFQYFMYQLLRGVLFLHSANIMHRDLKPSNILVKTNCDLKICDFGLARGFAIEEERELSKTVYVVTRWYRAPEVMLNASHYTRSLDIWSIGCIFAEMILKHVLFPGQHNIKQLDKIIEVLGFPDDDELGFISDKITLDYLKGLPKPVPSTLV
jgi:mitogen-activated protein kinase 1/3